MNWTDGANTQSTYTSIFTRRLGRRKHARKNNKKNRKETREQCLRFTFSVYSFVLTGRKTPNFATFSCGATQRNRDRSLTWRGPPRRWTPDNRWSIRCQEAAERRGGLGCPPRQTDLHTDTLPTHRGQQRPVSSTQRKKQNNRPQGGGVLGQNIWRWA